MLFRERADRQIRGDQVAVDAGKTVGIQVFQIRRFHVLAEEPAEIFRLQRDNIGSLLQRNRPLAVGHFLMKLHHRKQKTPELADVFLHFRIRTVVVNREPEL